MTRKPLGQLGDVLWGGDADVVCQPTPTARGRGVRSVVVIMITWGSR
jgi:hypothetical protein